MNNINNPDFIPDPNWKTMLGLAFIADAESGKPLTSQEDAEQKCFKSISNALKDTRISSQIGNWECLREPWILLPGVTEQKETRWARNTTVVFSLADDKTQIVIGVAGTNFVCSYDWFVEDLETETLVPWNKDIVINGPNNTGSATAGYVSKGTAQGIKNTWLLKDKISGGETLSEYLLDYLSSDDFKKIDNITVTVTGHSLGGALSPSLAKALLDNKSVWCPAHITPKINSYIFAGPTPGDETFRDGVQNGDIAVSSLYNIYDVVPHAWTLCSWYKNLINAPCLQNLHDIYKSVIGGDDSEFGKIVQTTVNWTINKSQTALDSGHKYVRWNGEVKVKGELPTEASIKVTADGMADLIEFDLYKEKNKQHLENIQKVCKIKDSDKDPKKELRLHLDYFCKFLVVLGIEHIQQYTKCVIDREDFHNAMKEYFGGSSLKELQGIDIIFKLFDEISTIA